MTESIAQHMTASPHCIGQEQTLDKAVRAMQSNRVRHLPVLHGGELVGVLSDRDIGLIESVERLNISEVTVEEAMSNEPYSVPPSTPLVEALTHMSERNLGSTVIVDAGQVVGIYTSMDAVRMLSTRL